VNAASSASASSMRREKGPVLGDGEALRQMGLGQRRLARIGVSEPSKAEAIDQVRLRVSAVWSASRADLPAGLPRERGGVGHAVGLAS
jgi:hypothetical protein